MCIAAAAGLICAVIYLQMVKHMKEICEYKGRQTANALVARAVDDCLLGENGDYLQIEYAEDGGIAAITADTYRINALENSLRRQINEEFSHIEDNEMGVPLGTLSGITALSGRGAEVRIKLHQVGAVDVSLKSDKSDSALSESGCKVGTFRDTAGALDRHHGGGRIFDKRNGDSGRTAAGALEYGRYARELTFVSCRT